MQLFVIRQPSRGPPVPEHAPEFSFRPAMICSISGLMLASMSSDVFAGSQPMPRERSARQRTFVPRLSDCVQN